MSQTFFAAGSPKEIANTIESHASKWSFTGGSGTFNALSMALWRNYIAWNSTLFTPESFDSALGSDGEVGEFVKVVSNQARSVGEQYISIITRQKLYWDAITDVNSANPINDCRLAKGIANAVTETQRVQSKFYAAAEKSYIYGAAFISSTWKTDKGYPYAVDQDGTLAYSGDVEIGVHDVSDVVYDWSIEEWSDLPWVAIRRVKNKHDLAAQHPDLADKILSTPSARSQKRLIPRFNMLSSFDNPDMIYFWEFYLRPCPSVPKGRFVVYTDPNCVLFDDDNLYETIPVEPLMFSKIQGTGLGKPRLSEMLPVQEIYDGILSTIASNVRAFGKQNIVMPDDADIDPVQIGDGMNVIRYHVNPTAPDGGIPKILDLLEIPAALFQFAGMMNTQVADLSGLSSTIRGNPPAGVTAASALATLTANASEFLSQAQLEYSMCCEKVMNHTINAYKRFATVEQTSKLVGTSSVGYVKTWKGEDLKSVQHIKLRQTNGLMDSLAGRQQIADNLLQAGLVNAGQYVKIQSGAPVESLFEEVFTTEMAVQAEIDAIVEGNSIIPIITDDHPKFIKAYQALLYNPSVRVSSKLTGDVMQLIETRISLEQQLQKNFELYQIIRGQPSPMAGQMMPPPGGGGGAAPNGNMPIPGAPNEASVQPAQPAQPAQPKVSL